MKIEQPKIDWSKKIFYVWRNSGDLLPARYLGVRKSTGPYKYIIAILHKAKHIVSEQGSEWEDIVFVNECGMQAGGIGLFPSVVNEKTKVTVHTVFYKSINSNNVYSATFINKQNAEDFFKKYNELADFITLSLVETELEY